MTITVDLLKKLFPTTKTDRLTEIIAPLGDAFQRYKINTLNRQAGFIAQAGHESAGFSVFVENLNYSSDGLQKIFGKYFPTAALANQYARKPEAIANRVYANRGGNGNEASGDGWKFRGHGFIQLTFRDTITKFGESVEMSVNDALEYLSTVEGAMVSAGWYWACHGLNDAADKDDIKAMTKIINGGYNGLSERTDLYNRAKVLLSGK